MGEQWSSSTSLGPQAPLPCQVLPSLPWAPERGRCLQPGLCPQVKPKVTSPAFLPGHIPEGWRLAFPGSPGGRESTAAWGQRLTQEVGMKWGGVVLRGREPLWL